MSEELKPCPFCGGADIRMSYLEGAKYEFMCISCPSRWTAFAESKVHAKDCWNTRAAPAPVTASDEMVERAENAYCMIAGVHVMPGEKARHMRGLRAALEAYESARGAKP